MTFKACLCSNIFCIFSCGKCVDNCKFCNGVEKKDCIHCKKNQYFENGTCVKECQLGSYPQEIEDGVKVCVG